MKLKEIIQKIEQKIEDEKKTEIITKQEKQQDKYKTAKQKKSKVYFGKDVQDAIIRYNDWN